MGAERRGDIEIRIWTIAGILVEMDSGHGGKRTKPTKDVSKFN